MPARSTPSTTHAPFGPKGAVMERLLEFLNGEVWLSFRSSPFGEERATRIVLPELDMEVIRVTDLRP
jgi:hypothetical protein